MGIISNGNTVIDNGAIDANEVDTTQIANGAVTGVKLSGLTNFKNIIINGDMSIAQRETSESGVISGGYYTVDRFRWTVSASDTVTLSQSTDTPSGQGFSNSFKVDVTTADTSIGADQYAFVEQSVEALNCQYLKYGTANAQTLTLSFWVKSSKTGTYCIDIDKPDNTRYNYVAEYTIDSANTWEKKTIIIAPDSNIQSAGGAIDNNNGEGFAVKFTLATGSNRQGTNETWNASVVDGTSNQVNFLDSTANDWYLTGVQLEAGTTASDFEFLPFDMNLQRCQRYYQKSYDIASAPGTVTSDGALWSNIIRNASNQNYWDVRCYQTMRTSPTVSTYSTTSGVSGNFRNITDNTTNASAVANTSETGFSIRPNSGTNQNLGDVIAVHWEASAEL